MTKLALENIMLKKQLKKQQEQQQQNQRRTGKESTFKSPRFYAGSPNIQSHNDNYMSYIQQKSNNLNSKHYLKLINIFNVKKIVDVNISLIQAINKQLLPFNKTHSY